MGERKALLASLVALASLSSGVVAAGGARGETGAEVPGAGGDLLSRPSLLPDPKGRREQLAEHGLAFEVVYTADGLANLDGGVARKSGFLGNLDATLTWQTEPGLGRDLGTFFLYGLWNHGDRPSRWVGDLQVVDNIEAPDSAKLFEAWWQKALLDGRASILLGLYDVNSEFYAIDSAEVFLHSSFGMGAALGASGVNGPSIFPTAGLGARLKVEPVEGFELQAAIVEGIPGDPRRPKGIRVDLEADEGAFVIVEVAHHRSAVDRADAPDRGGNAEEGDADPDVTRGSTRRRIGRTWAEQPGFLRVSLGSWVYTARQPHVSRTRVGGDPVETRGHPGLYATAAFDAARLDLLETGGLAVFMQLGWADGDVAPFAGYAGGGLVYQGLLPLRPKDETGFGVAAAFAGDALRDAARDDGREPGRAEIALEWTHRLAITPWLSLQGDVQYVVNPGSLRDRPDAWIVGARWELTL